MGIAVSHRYCRCDVILSLEKCDGIYVVCEVSSKMTVQQSGLTGLVHDAMRQPPLLPVRGFIVFILLLGMNAPPRVESDLSSLNTSTTHTIIPVGSSTTPRRSSTVRAGPRIL